MLAYEQAALHDATKRRRNIPTALRAKIIVLLKLGTEKRAMLTQAIGDQASVVQCQLVLLPLP